VSLPNEPSTDDDVKLAVWIECEGALSALQGAIRRAREVYSALPAVARDDLERQLARIARTTGLLVLTLGFPEYLTEQEKK
jgi:hypothetical protein